jgi:hypothetical protein
MMNTRLAPAAGTAARDLQRHDALPRQLGGRLLAQERALRITNTPHRGGIMDHQSHRDLLPSRRTSHCASSWSGT